jgi:DNA polymerase III delta prime subunit
MRTLKGKENFLKKLATQKKARGSYIFSGRNGTGKHAMAENFIRFLLGDKKDVFWIGVTRVTPLEKKTKGVVRKKQISTKQVKEALSSMSLSSGAAAYSICLIEEAGRLTLTAQNALLKSLEEPKRSGVFILLVESEEHLLPTIRSRSAILRFGLGTQKENAPTSFLENTQKWKEELSFLLANPFYKKIKLIEKIAKDGENFPQRLNFWIEFLATELEEKTKKSGDLKKEKALTEELLALKKKTRNREGLSLRLALESIFL